MRPRNFRATAILCIVMMLADAVLAQLPHSHDHFHAGDFCSAGACHASHACGMHLHVHHTAEPTACQHEHAAHKHDSAHQHCSHSGTATCEATDNALAGNEATSPPAGDDHPCDDCALCRHQGQAALPCTQPPVLAFLTICSPLVDRQVAQIASLTPHVYQGRGPPCSL